MLDGDKTTDCTHCEGGDSQSYWNISLDLDLLQTIVNFYPEWFKNCNMSAVTEGRGIKLQNKDSSLSVFQEQRQKLVKARIGSILKHKFPKKMGKQTLHQPTLQDERSAKFELVKENIFVDAVQAFKSPCNSPKMEFGLDDDSDDIFSPTPPYEFNEHSQGSLPSLEASEPNLNQGSPCSEITSFSMSPPSSTSSPMPSAVSPQTVHEQIAEYMAHMPQHSVATNKNKKKTKPKTQPKARTIKFHEYKGPPNSKNTSASSNPESPPQLNFQQQQLILELQSAFHKHDSQPKEATQKNSGDQSSERNEEQISFNPTPTRMSHFEDLKVSDLRSELKKRNLPVSGSKPQLIERLKTSMTGKDSHLLGNSGTDTVKELLNVLPFDPCDSLDDVNPLSKEEIIVQLQQIYIERLQMDLERSQRQLLECQQPTPSLTVASTDLAMPPTVCHNETSLSSENKTSQKQLIQQLLQQKIQKQQKSHRLKASTASTSNSTLTALLKSGPLNAAKREEDDFPGVIPITESTNEADPRSSSLPSFSALCKTPAPLSPQFQICRPPPDYNAATKHLQKVKQPPTEGNPSKKHKPCQAVDDVLAVLIASGDLPPSAAEQPFQTTDIFSSTNLAQSLMDITPPSSAGLCTASLDFGPLLDLDEMDFGLDNPPELKVDYGESTHLIKTEKDNKRSFLSTGFQEEEEEVMEWLPLPNDSPSFQTLTIEPLFPNTQETALDFLEEDFNTPNDLFFPWGEKPT